MGFTALNIIICVLNLAYLPVIYLLRKIYAYEELNGQSTAINQNSTTNNGTISQPTINQNYAIDANKPLENDSGGGFSTTDGYQNAVQQPATNTYDPLNPQW